MDLAGLTAAVGKAAVQFSTWLSLQEAVSLLAANAGNLVDRLPAVQAVSHYKGLPEPLQLRDLVVSRTLTSLDNVIRRLRDKLNEMEECVRAQEKLCVQVWEALGTAAPAPACAQPQPKSGFSAAQMAEAVEDAWYMCRDELCLKAAVLSRLHPAVSPAEYANMQDLLQVSLHVRQDSLAAVLLLNW